MNLQSNVYELRDILADVEQMAVIAQTVKCSVYKEHKKLDSKFATRADRT